MTALDFRTSHGDPATWTTADMETYEHLAEVDTLATLTCWFCGSDNQPATSICGFCNHHTDDGPALTPAKPLTTA
jgi:hypothetical protein